MRGFFIWSCVVQSKWETEIRIVKEARIQDVVSVVPETEAQDRSSDSEDNVLVATLLRPKSSSTLTLQQIEEYVRKKSARP